MAEEAAHSRGGVDRGGVLARWAAVGVVWVLLVAVGAVSGVVDSEGFPRLSFLGDVLSRVSPSSWRDVPVQRSGDAAGLGHGVSSDVTAAADGVGGAVGAGENEVPLYVPSVPAGSDGQSTVMGVALEARPQIASRAPADGAVVTTLSPVLSATDPQAGAELKYRFSISRNGSGNNRQEVANSGWVDTGSWRVPAVRGSAANLVFGEDYTWTVQVSSSASCGVDCVTSDARRLLVRVWQPEITSLLSQNTETRGFSPIAGNYTTEVIDLSVGVVGPVLGVTRNYNSMDPRRSGAFGAGWSSLLDARVSERGNTPDPAASDAVVTYPDGSEVGFGRNPDGSFSSPQGRSATLIDIPVLPVPGIPVKVKYVLVDKDSTRYLFGQGLGNGRYGITEVLDAQGRAVTFTWDAGNRITAVKSVASGRALTLTWSAPSGGVGAHVTKVVTDPATAGKPDTALTRTYTYEGDNLQKACHANFSTDCTTYGHSLGASLHRADIINSKPANYWPLDDLKNVKTAKDEVGSSSPTYHDVQLQQPGPPRGTQYAAKFNGKSSYLKLPFKADSDDAVSMWFKAAPGKHGVLLGSSKAEMGHGDSSQYYRGNAMEVSADGMLISRFCLGKVIGRKARLCASIKEYKTSLGQITGDRDGWHHVLIGANGSSYSVFLDGAKVGGEERVTQGWAALGLSNGPLHEAFKNYYVGAGFSQRGGTSEVHFDGFISDVAYYKNGSYPSGAAVKGLYDHSAAGLLSSVTSAAGVKRAAVSYDPVSARVTQVVDPNGGVWGVGGPERSTIDGQSRVCVTVSEPGSVTAPEGSQEYRQKYCYDSVNDNRVVWKERTEAGRSVRTTYDYDVRGFLARMIDPNENSAEFGNDVHGNMVRQATCQNTKRRTCSSAYYEYSPAKPGKPDPRDNRLIAARDGRSKNKDDNTYLTKYSYDSAGNRIGVTTPPVVGFPQGRTTTVTYSTGSEAAAGGGRVPAGLPVVVMSPGKSRSTLTYQKSGDLAATTNAVGLVTAFTTDGVGRVLSRKEISDSYPQGLTTTYTFDARGRIASQTDPVVGSAGHAGGKHQALVTNSYDSDDNLLKQSVKDSAGRDGERSVSFTVDQYGRLASATNANGNTTKLGYDKYGRLSSRTDPEGTINSWTYSPRGFPLTEKIENYTGASDKPQPKKALTVWSRAYDPAGRLASQTDAVGNTTCHRYYDNGLPADVTIMPPRVGCAVAADSAQERFVVEKSTYDAAGYVTEQVTDNGATTSAFTVDAAGRTTRSVVGAKALPAVKGAQRVSDVSFTADDEAEKVTLGDDSGLKQSQTSVFDPMGKLLSQTITGVTPQDAVTKKWARDQRGLVTLLTDPNGQVTRYGYDEAGRPTTVTAPWVSVEASGQKPQMVSPVDAVGYNTFGDAVTETDPNGNITTSEYDRLSQLTKVVLPAYTPPGSSTITAAMTWRYDKSGRVIGRTDPRGKTTSFAYDQLGDVVKTTDAVGGTVTASYDTPGGGAYVGHPLRVTDQAGVQTQATYDQLGRQLTSTLMERYPVQKTLTTTYSYARGGLSPLGPWLTSVTSPGKVTTAFAHNALGQRVSMTDAVGNVTRFDYDVAGHVRNSTLADGTSVATEHDVAGNPTRVQYRDAKQKVLATTTASFDKAGHPLSVTDARDRTRTFGYDALGRLTKQVEPAAPGGSIITGFGYDKVGNRTRFTDGRNNTWTYTYTPWNLPGSVIEPATATWGTDATRTTTNSYDAAARLVKQTQPGGVSVEATYDDNGNLTSQTGTGAETTTAARTFGYDKAGRVTSAATAAAGTTSRTDEHFTYTDSGQVWKATGSAGASEFAYTDDGALAKRVDPAGTTTYTYDKAGRPATGTEPTTKTKLAYSYNKLNQLTTIGYTTSGSTGKGNTRAFTYDDLHQLTGDTLTTSSGATVAGISYGHDANGNITSKKTTGFTRATANTYTYDDADRLTSWNDGTTTTKYGYDASGNRIQVGANVYTYDARGQLTSDGANTYAYTARGTQQEHKTGTTTVKTVSDAFGQVASQGSRTYAYDALGRVMTAGGKPASPPGAGIGIATPAAAFTYTGTTNTPATDGTHSYTYDPAGTPLGIGSKQTANSAPTGTLAWTDQHTDVVGAFTATGTTLQASQTYTPLGKPLTTTTQPSPPTTPTRPSTRPSAPATRAPSTAPGRDSTQMPRPGNLGYQSGWTDPVTGHVNMTARWYNPTTGQFPTKDTRRGDPVPNSAAANLFAYANANPLTKTDPTGHGVFDDTFFARVSSAIGSIGQEIVDAGNNGLQWLENKASDAGGWLSDNGPLGIAEAVGQFVKDNASTIVSFVVGAVAFVGCTALTAGVGVIGCSMLAGALGGAVGSGIDYGRTCAASEGGCTVLGGVKAVAIGAVAGAVGGAVGGAVAGPLGGRLASSALGRVLPPVALHALTGGASGAAGGAAGGAVSGGAGYANECGSRPGGCTLKGLGEAVGQGAVQGAAAGAIIGGALGAAGGLQEQLGRSRTAVRSGTALDDEPLIACHSFTADTRVLMADGTTKPINQIKPGDHITNANPGDSDNRHPAHRATDTVAQTHTTTTDHDLIDITTTTRQPNPAASGKQAANTGTTSTITATANHPIYDITQAAFVNAEHLRVGDQLGTSPSDSVGTVTAIRPHPNTTHQPTHDLTITNTHTYYIISGTTPILVHNTACNRTVSSDQTVEENRASFDRRLVGEGFSGVYDPVTNTVVARLSGTTEQSQRHGYFAGRDRIFRQFWNNDEPLVAQYGGHAGINLESFANSDRTVGFSATVVHGDLRVGWVSRSVNGTNFNASRAPVILRSNLMEALRRATGLPLESNWPDSP
ncbi:RHS repeat-associated core domain-containing protein [Amycolatopsis sp. cmx-11-12]|uniref:RHS repeat-associated core domain-containing protein n=1 Tax=Amycolatopsis sp. cmx-11-12 TaxID=2785795 RepID=UPI003917B773